MIVLNEKLKSHHSYQKVSLKENMYPAYNSHHMSMHLCLV